MICKEDLLEAIAECQGQRNPNANTCIKLASYLTILKSLEEDSDPKKESQDQPATQPEENFYSYAESEFMNKLAGKSVDEIVDIFAELMETIKVLNPRLYQGVLRKL